MIKNKHAAPLPINPPNTQCYGVITEIHIIKNM